MTRQILRRPVGDIPADLARDEHPVIARVLAARGVRDASALDYSLARLHPWDTLTDVNVAAQLLAEAVRGQRTVLVVGDFDADGATGCAVAVRGLRALGAVAVDYLVPDRFRFGYGLSPEIVDVARAREPAVLVTVDNGTSSLEGVARARAAGIQVVVTDHHLAGAELPAADALVNPNRPGDAFPSKCLAGVGVMFYVLLALRARLRADGWFDARPEPRLADLLDLVAVGTVADVVPLDHNNRILVEQGLRRIRAGRCQPGVAALLRVAGRDPRRTTSGDLAFAVAPRLNAAGRLTDISLGIECLLTDAPDRASAVAGQLDALNRERRRIEADMQAMAETHLETLASTDEGTLPFGLALYDPDWHQGVVGILASRVKERFHRPVIAFAPAGDGELKGSARSVPGVHMRDALAAVSDRNPGLLDRFGGHAMAAGLTLAEANLPAFREAFNRVVRESLAPEDLAGSLLSDGPLSGHELGLELAERLLRSGPWGQGFPPPLFDGAFRVHHARVVGASHLKLVVSALDGGGELDAIAFNQAPDGVAPGLERVHLAYRLEPNEFRGVTSAQLVVEQVAPAAADGAVS